MYLSGEARLGDIIVTGLNDAWLRRLPRASFVLDLDYCFKIAVIVEKDALLIGLTIDFYELLVHSLARCFAVRSIFKFNGKSTGTDVSGAIGVERHRNNNCSSSSRSRYRLVLSKVT